MRAREFAEPRAAGCIIVAEDTGRWCLQQRSDSVTDPGVWSTWGGGVEPGESLEQTVRRELAEEAGYTGPIKLERLHTSPQYATFIGRVPREFEPRLNHEGKDWCWVEAGEWPEPLHPGLARALAKIKQGVTEAQSAKTGIYQTDVLGAKAYHAKCMEPNCNWESKRFDRIKQAQAAAEKHAKSHFKQSVAEGAMKDLHIDLQDQQWDAIVGYVINGLKKNMDIGRIELNLYKYAGQEMFDVDQELQDRGFKDIADLADHIRQHNGRYVPPTDFNLGKGVAENFADGKKPGRKGLSRRVGIPKKATLAQLSKIAKSSTGERRRMAQWQLNMRRGKARKNK